MPERRPPSPASSPRTDGRPQRPSRAPDPAPRPPQPAQRRADGTPSGRDAGRPVDRRTGVEKRSTVEKRAAADSPWQRVTPESSTPPAVSLRMRERLAERKKTERRRTLSRGARIMLIVGAAIAVVWAIGASPLFALNEDKVEVAGITREIDASEVNAVLGSYAGDSLLTLNVPHIADQLREVTGVRDATVERVWPQGLRVTLVARHPVAAIPSGEQFVLLDADAVQVGIVDAVPAGLPVMDVPLGDARVLEAALAVIRSLPQEVLDRVEGLGAQTEDSVQFTLRDGPQVEWGSAEESALKAQVLTVLLDSGQAAGVAVVDVSAPTLPITRTAP